MKLHFLCVWQHVAKNMGKTAVTMVGAVAKNIGKTAVAMVGVAAKK